MTRLEELALRLRDAQASVRRVAIMDLAAVPDGAGAPLLCEHLRSENDERALIAAAAALARLRHDPARALLKGLYDDPKTPVGAAIAAIRAHDAIEGFRR